MVLAGCGGSPPATSTPSTTSATTPAAGPKVHIIIYSDPQCPSCYTLFTQIEPQIVAQYVKTGKVTLVTRYLDTKGAASNLTAQAILCAGDQGKYEEYRANILAAWAKNGADAYSKANLESAAGTLGLDAAAFDTCLTSGKHAADISDNKLAAGQAGGGTLPTMFIDDVKLEGQQPWVIVSKAIDDELAKKG
jgi:protein-disulfide isomerase